MTRKISFGIVGLGLMGKEFASAVARWCHLYDDLPIPVVKGICETSNQAAREWFNKYFSEGTVQFTSLDEMLSSDEIDAVYCAVPHHLHEPFYTRIIRSGKHLLGEKPFGIDKKANEAVLQASREHPEVIVRCSSEFPYFPAMKRMIQWLEEHRYGQIIEVRSGFHHSSDLDLTKPINWKRMAEFNGEYGCMGDLGIHTSHVPFRMGWRPKSVYADLQKIVTERPDGKGNMVPCTTWDNAVLTCRADDPYTGREFSLVFEMKRMAPGATNTWFLEVYGTKGSARFSTSDPKALYTLETTGKEQGWTRNEVGSQSFVPTITGSIFETGFSDSIQQMLAAFIYEFREDHKKHPFPNVLPEETRWSHILLTGALESHATGKQIKLIY
jgi:predicted dehydrogenase